MEQPLCPKCGAYWDCDCVIEAFDLPPGPALDMPIDPDCDHDWLDAVGVELLLETDNPDAHVVVCRLCGSYAVIQTSQD